MEVPACIPEGAEPSWRLNSALVSVYNVSSSSALVQTISEDCANCTWRAICRLDADNSAFLVDSAWPTQITFAHAGRHLCHLNASLHNLGRYAVNFRTCEFETVVEGESKLTATLVATFGLLFLLFAHDLYLHFKSGWWSAQEDHDEYYFGNVPRHRTSRRLLSVSVFRGLCVCLMAVANNECGGLPQFLHATWDGLNIADIVLPSFLFCAGLSSQIAIAHQSSTRIDWPKLLNRLFYLCVIGLFVVNGGTDWRSLRLMGVLQRLALCQLIVYPLQVKTNQHQAELRITRKLRRFPSEEEEPNPDEYDIIEGDDADYEPLIEPTAEGEYATNFSHYFGEWANIGLAYFFTAFLAILATMLTILVEVPGCPLGYFGPGGVGDQGEWANCTGGLAGWLDRRLLGRHIYPASPVKAVYNSLDLDPEGILGTFTAALNVAGGALAGQIVRWYPARCEQYTRLITYGSAHVLVGFLVGKAGIPINKQLWSLSFSIVTVGISMLIYCVCRLAVDHVKTRIKWRSLAYVGDNALLIFVLQSAFAGRLPYEFDVGTSSLARVLLSLWTVLVTFFAAIIFRFYDIKFKL